MRRAAVTSNATTWPAIESSSTAGKVNVDSILCVLTPRMSREQRSENCASRARYARGLHSHVSLLVWPRTHRRTSSVLCTRDQQPHSLECVARAMRAIDRNASAINLAVQPTPRGFRGGITHDVKPRLSIRAYETQVSRWRRLQPTAGNRSLAPWHGAVRLWQRGLASLGTDLRPS